jgi:hypothetical protein
MGSNSNSLGDQSVRRGGGLAGTDTAARYDIAAPGKKVTG